MAVLKTPHPVSPYAEKMRLADYAKRLAVTGEDPDPDCLGDDEEMIRSAFEKAEEELNAEPESAWSATSHDTGEWFACEHCGREDGDIDRLHNGQG